ncbi:hypothetical protein D9756_006777 [Leucocoprinus leucothites]|uniref:Uncharacterized protein n=1 Tax=Leucocoprinus leucothites TaxID=201217 RepID=A0A8H5G2D7_9AGAR|nr:hypothetical protein D9756_006777 [Leucoagaricus leucothites]
MTITVLISTHIARQRRQHIKVMGESDPEIANQYLSIISMLVESFALESLWMLVMIILDLFRLLGKDSTEEFVQVTAVDGSSPLLDLSSSSHCLSQVDPIMNILQILAYLLVTYRVTTNRAWKKDTEQQLSSLQWNRDERSQATQLGTVTQASLPAGLREEA